MATRNYMSGLFGKSPISPLQEHMHCVYSCIKHLPLLIDAVIAEDSKTIAEHHQAIRNGEHAADELKKDLRHHLPKGLFMPIDRRDVLDVLLMQDAIANQAKHISGLVMGRKMTLPEELHEEMVAYVSRCVDSVKQALQIINELDELVEAGFRGREVERVEAMISELDKIEGDTDKLQHSVSQLLFKIEDDLKPTDVMFTYRLIAWIGRIADNAQKVGSRLQLMLAR